MVSIVQELKGKLAELEAKLEAIRVEALILEGQKAAFETVIKVFDPRATCEPHQQPKRKDRSTPGRRVTDLLRGRDVRRGVLELLRGCGRTYPGRRSVQAVRRARGFCIRDRRNWSQSRWALLRLA